MKKILILGPQGSGKGTQAEILSKKLDIPTLSMGQLLRDEIATGSELGKTIDKIIHGKGNLVPDDIALEVLKKRLKKENTSNGYILDGYPRNISQKKTYETFDTPTDVLIINVPKDESLSRLLKRAELEGRPDDTKDLILHRLDVYERETLPIIDEYKEQGIVRVADGIGSIEEIAKRIEKALS